MKTSLLALVLIVLTNATGFANNQPLVGTWILERSDNPQPDGSVVPYCAGVHGMAIYTPEGYVTVSINCGPRQQVNEPADISGRMFFYAGVYRYNGRQVEHLLMNASEPKLIGEKVIRTVTIRGNQLILSGVNQGQVFSAFWRKVR